MDKDKALAMWADLLERWQEAEISLIYEMSGSINAAIAEMKQEAARLDAEFKKGGDRCKPIS